MTIVNETLTVVVSGDISGNILGGNTGGKPDRRFAIVIGRRLMTVALPLLLASCSGNSYLQDHNNVSRSDVQAVATTESFADESSFMALANEMAAQGEYNAAIPLYRRAVKYHPFASPPLVGLGDSLRAVGQYQQAEQAYQSALSHNEKNPQALRGLGKTYIALHRPTMAIPMLNDAIALNSHDVESIDSLALALELQGNVGAAMVAYRKGLDIAPDNLKLLTNYGLSLALQSRYDQSIKILKRAAQNNNAGAAHRQNLAMAYALAGDEVMSARLLAIDDGPELTNENLGYFRVLASLTSKKRFDAVMRQSISHKTDISRSANEVYDHHNRVKNITVARLVEVPPEPMVKLKKEDIPPLLGPQGWALQIAAYRKKSELMPGWRKLKKKYFDIIGALEPRRSEIDLGKAKRKGGPHGFYYRLNAGPLTSLKDAEIACRKIRKRGTDCWVRVPEVSEGKVAVSDSVKAQKFRRKVYQNRVVRKPDQGV